MQSNPIVVDGTPYALYATSPKLRVIALNAATGRELWYTGWFRNEAEVQSFGGRARPG